jgi:hypothetical protein
MAHLYSWRIMHVLCIAIATGYSSGASHFSKICCFTSYAMCLMIVQAFLTGPKFQGVKMVPPGPHIITTSQVSRDNCVPTVSRWVHVQPGTIQVGRWVAERGHFEALTDDDEVRSLPAACNEFDAIKWQVIQLAGQAVNHDQEDIAGSFVVSLPACVKPIN